MNEWGLFNDEAADYTEGEAVEGGFYSQAEAEAALLSRYSPEDGLSAHLIEETEDDEDNDLSDDEESPYHDDAYLE